jgi:hypothetical protein
MKLDLNPELTPEQAFFHGTTRQFLDDKVPTSLVRELRNDPAGFGRDFWRQAAQRAQPLTGVGAGRASRLTLLAAESRFLRICKYVDDGRCGAGPERRDGRRGAS